MKESLKIILPVLPSTKAKEIYLKGVWLSENHSKTIYITKFYEHFEFLLEEHTEEDNVIYGYFTNSQRPTKLNLFSNFFILKDHTSFQLIKVFIDGHYVNITDNKVIILYEYDTIKKSETLDIIDSDIFSTLKRLINGKHLHQQIPNKPVLGDFSWLMSSMFYQHIRNYIHLITWLISGIKVKKTMSIKYGNFILAIIMDMFLGYFLLNLLTQDKKELSLMLMGVLEITQEYTYTTTPGLRSIIRYHLVKHLPDYSISTKLVNYLFSLLKWIMGAPAGLKLNMAFNNMLGKYFSYHIQLWWLFLDLSGEKLDIILHIIHYLGYFGFTIQAAIISDMICIATFHSYCIYVYAARLFNLQISGLIALLRLFVGKKYNPLRGGVDSCEYTNQELFVGTVAFTILLLLLPTTFMYYIVFTVFRLLSLTVQYVLAKLIYLVQILPLYVISLWVVNSPKVAGNILMEVINTEGSSNNTVIRMKLARKSILDLVNDFRPPVQETNCVQWTALFSKILIGRPII